MSNSKIKKLLKSAVLKVPPIRTLYSDYLALSESQNQLLSELETLRSQQRVDPDEAYKVLITALEGEITTLRDQNLSKKETIAALGREIDATRTTMETKVLELERLGAEQRRRYDEAIIEKTQLEQRLLASVQAELANVFNTRLAGYLSITQSQNRIQQLAFERLERRLNALLPDESSGTHSTTTSRWLDLIESVLTGTVLRDQPMDPWSAGDYRSEARLLGRDWPSQALTMIGVARMRNLRELTERTLQAGVAGDFIETGVWRGGACIYMKAILEAFGDQRRRVFVADSFRGLPPPDALNYPADRNDQHHTYQPLAVSRQAVEDNFRVFDLLDDRVVFLEGWFKDTLPTAPIEQIALLRLDGDMYESTMQALEALYHKVTPGGFVIVDDYVLKPCASAVDTFRKTRSIEAPMQDIDGAAVWWQVQ